MHAKEKGTDCRQENLFSGLKNRLLQELAMSLPGGSSLRVALHRLRGVRIGKDVWIGYQALIETGYPTLVSIGDRAIIGVRSTIIAHFQELRGVTIKEDVYIGACALILPGVTVGRGAVVAAGSVVTASVPPKTVVQGNPAKRMAKCEIALGSRTSRREFIRHLKLDRATTLNSTKS
jgi:acetyltransferase-like isoleucine patch superfamily enzyme